KPRYKALKMLDTLEGNQLIVDGEGSNVSAIASINDVNIVLILTNYDETGRNYEAVPVTFKNLENVNYKLTKTFLNGLSDISLNLTPIDGELKLTGDKALILPANMIVSLELSKM
ncbi:MAG: hypothetical protein NUV87_01175, partial [Candidatus Roizmanbacteria bacterium]|nr:hypothetical protein [Candidatus Roizmanbacteria bacterium]